MDALFNSLPRNKHYEFHFVNHSIVALFHEYMPDGTLKVTKHQTNLVVYINPNQLQFVTV